MRKRILSLLIVLSMTFSTVFAATPMKKIQYVSPYLTGLEKIAERVEKEALREDNLQTLLMLYTEMQEEFERIYTMQAIATLRQMQVATSEHYAKEYTHSSQVYSEAYELVRETLVCMVSSQYETNFRKLWGDETVDALLEAQVLGEEEQAIYAELAKKRERYRALSLEAVATIDGTQYFMDDVSDFTLRRRIYDQWLRDLGQIYIDIVNLCKKLDKNYYLLTYQAYNRSYTPVDASIFEETVAKSFAKVYDKVKRSISLEQTDVEWNGSTETLFDFAAQGFSAIDESLVESYDLMKENRLFDVEYSETKSSGAFTILFPSYESVFLYVQPTDEISALTSFYHEFGHFNQMRQGNLHVYWPGEQIDLDSAEVTSQALPLLMSDQVDDLFGEEVGDAFAKDVLMTTLLAIPSACAVDAFEQFAFSTENLTYEALCRKFDELCKTYHLPWNGQTWPQIQHIYNMPGYYISYAVSATSAIEVWMKYLENEKLGVGTYLAAVNACENGYRAVLTKANLRNPFYSPELIEEISSVSEKTFGVMVDTYDHWAEESIDRFVRSDLLHGYLGSDGKTYFKPEQDITRAEFVKLLYSICTDEELSEESTQFTDVEPGTWYARYIEWASREGLVKGVSETEFRPTATITRQDMAVMLARYLTWCNRTVSHTGAVSIADGRELSAYAKDAVETLYRAKILKGLPSGAFAPNNTVTRAMASTAICGAYDYVEESVNVPDEEMGYAYVPAVLPAQMLVPTVK